MAPAPSPRSITIDKEEPAYIYHRLRGEDQSPLKGIKHTTRTVPQPTSGDTNSIEVPLGSNLVINDPPERGHANADADPKASGPTIPSS